MLKFKVMSVKLGTDMNTQINQEILCDLKKDERQ